DEVETAEQRPAPADDGAGEHPSVPPQEHLAHELQTCSRLARGGVRPCRRPTARGRPRLRGRPLRNVIPSSPRARAVEPRGLDPLTPWYRSYSTAIYSGAVFGIDAGRLRR